MPERKNYLQRFLTKYQEVVLHSFIENPSSKRPVGLLNDNLLTDDQQCCIGGRVMFTYDILGFLTHLLLQAKH